MVESFLTSQSVATTIRLQENTTLESYSIKLVDKQYLVSVFVAKTRHNDNSQNYTLQISLQSTADEAPLQISKSICWPYPIKAVDIDTVNHEACILCETAATSAKATSGQKSSCLLFAVSLSQLFTTEITSSGA